MLKDVLRLTNRRARLLVGLLLAGLFCVQCTTTSEADPQVLHATAIDGEIVGGNAPAVLDMVDRLARTDHVALLEYCLQQYSARYRDYTCLLVKQERIRGRLGVPQSIEVKFMESPFSVAMAWQENAPAGDRVVYVEGKYGGQMLVRPSGALLRKLAPVVLRKPDGDDAMRSTLRPVSLFGFRRGMESLRDVYLQARQNGDIRESFDGYAEVDGRTTAVIVRHLPPKGDYPAAETRVYIDLEYLVPIMMEYFDWDENLQSRYLYRNVRFNVDLSADDFTPQRNDMPEPN